MENPKGTQKILYPIHDIAEQRNLFTLKVFINNIYTKYVQENSYTKYELDQKISKILDTRNDKGETPLMYAAYNNNHLFVDFLLNHGVDPNISDKKNNKALFYALLKRDEISGKEYYITKEIDLIHIENIITNLSRLMI